MYGLAIFFILTDSRAVAGRFLKVVWKLLKTLHYVYYLLSLFLCQIWPCSGPHLFVMPLHLCLIYVCIIILYIGSWTVLGQAGCSIKQSHFKEIALND